MRPTRDYYYKTLPFLTNYLYVNSDLEQKACFNKCSIATFLGVEQHTIAKHIKLAEEQKLIQFLGTTKELPNDKKSEWPIAIYVAVDLASLVEQTQQLTGQKLKYDERVASFCTYTNFTRELYTPEKEKLIRADKVAKYSQEYEPFIVMLAEINESRPTTFKSTYLADNRLRESNILCTTRNPIKHPDNKSRAKLLTEYEILNFLEFDTNGSIYRLCYNMYNKIKLSHNVDIYKEFFLAAFGKDLTLTLRNSLKVLCMPIFMSNGAKNGYNSTLVYKTNLSKADQMKADALTTLSKELNLTPRQVLDKLTTAMYKVLNCDHFPEGEIFIYESNLHILMNKAFLDDEVKSLNVYDGFYFDEGTMTQDLYDQFYDEATDKLKHFERRHQL